MRMTPPPERSAPRPRLKRALPVGLGLLALVAAVPPILKAIQYWQLPTLGQWCGLQGCRGGFCYSPHPMNAYCTAHCGEPADCISGYECVQAEDGVHFCRQAPTLQQGDRCWMDEQCQSGTCASFTHRDLQQGEFYASFCVEPCSSDADCPESERCEATRTGSFCTLDAVVRQGAERFFDAQRRFGSPTREPANSIAPSTSGELAETSPAP